MSEYRWDPVGQSRWVNIGADFSQAKYRLIKERAEARDRFQQPDIFMTMKHCTIKLSGYSKPYKNKVSGVRTKPIGSITGYTVTGTHTFVDPRKVSGGLTQLITAAVGASFLVNCCMLMGELCRAVQI